MKANLPTIPPDGTFLPSSPWVIPGLGLTGQQERQVFREQLGRAKVKAATPESFWVVPRGNKGGDRRGGLRN